MPAYTATRVVMSHVGRTHPPTAAELRQYANAIEGGLRSTACGHRELLLVNPSKRSYIIRFAFGHTFPEGNGHDVGLTSHLPVVGDLPGNQRRSRTRISAFAGRNGMDDLLLFQPELTAMKSTLRL